MTVLPEAARRRVLAVAGAAMGSLPAEELPPELKTYAGFAPAKRAKLAARALAAVLESDEAFRGVVAGVARAASPELAALVESGEAPATAPPDEVAALAYLLRPDGWETLVEAAADALAASAASAVSEESSARLRKLSADLDAARAERDRLRAELDALRSEAATLRRRLRDAEAAAASATAASAAESAAAASAASAAESAEKASRRLRARVAELERELAAAQRPVVEDRGAGDVRLRVLLDAVVEAAHGLRRELALPPSTSRPGDDVSAGTSAPSGGVGGREDAAWLDALLAAPRAHLIVDGYNVTKTGYPSLSLEEQRNRLLSALRPLAARTGAEVTVVFDGTTVGGVVTPVVGRGIRVRFSETGQTADEVIAAYVRAEPPGRVVVVASSDREVQESARRAGARSAPSDLLLALLGR